MNAGKGFDPFEVIRLNGQQLDFKRCARLCYISDGSVNGQLSDALLNGDFPQRSDADIKRLTCFPPAV